MSDKNEPNVRFDEEMGVHHVGNRVDTQEVKNEYDFEVEAEAVFKRLAEDIYKGRKAGIREPLTNSVTSVLRANAEGYLDDLSEGIIVIQLYEEGGATRLTLRDNGVGITKDEIDRVVTQIGKSTTRTATDLTGRFGMGFLATWMLTGGTDGGFVMHSNPRGVDEGPFKGIWDSSGFSELDGEMETVGGLGENDYGVEFEIFIDNSISTEELTDWIDTYAEWTRIPVLFKHHTEEGVEDEEYPTKSLLDKYEAIESGEKECSDFNAQLPRDTDLHYYTVEHDAFTAVNSNLSSTVRRQSLDKCILMDVPIGMSWSRREFPLKTVEVRLNYETPMVVDGPHEGMFVTTGSENPEELGDRFISRKTLTSEDVVTPFPTGTRDVLQDETGFEEWLGEQFYDMYYDDIAGIVRSVDTLSDYCGLNEEQRESFHNVVEEIVDTHRVSAKSLSTLKSRAGTDFSSAFESVLPSLHNGKISVAPEGRNGVSRQENRENKSLRSVVLKTYESERDVYMAHRITQEAAEFVWASETDHYVVRVPSGNQDKYERVFGWKKLNELDYETDLDIPDEKRQEFTEERNDVKDERITIHVGSYSNTVSMTAEEFKQHMENLEPITDTDGNTKFNIRKAILFTRSGLNISDNDNLVGEVVATLSVSEDVFEYLEGTENIWTAEYALERDVVVPLANGEEINLREETPDEPIYHVMKEETLEIFRDEDVMESIQEWILSETDAPDEGVYTPISHFEREFANLDITWQTWTVGYLRNSYNTIPLDSNVSLYAKAVIESDSPAVEALKTVDADWTNGGKELIETVEENL